MCANIAEKYFVKLKCISHETKELFEKGYLFGADSRSSFDLVALYLLVIGTCCPCCNATKKDHCLGIVTDSSGEPVIGASITEKGTSNGTISDVKGHFGISVSSTAILQISFIGYRTEEVTASPAKTSLKVILRENSEQLEEVVVVGYGVQKKPI